ncbi:LLM class flavin-dependent oxidoreductase [Amycolatopsis pithecellobii]|uniref:LLM class flavin-dependent oxidoreductase n=1 Tax=Amycolatopsis pithecellobii TaxID=664692 RepID=A0A6N7Z527_9PSEU|nr:LLM class flavin-dependent oxidoreductase [Amycolatopsis pithecellobii]MTD55540.1 LLM class flavin-dependent oxidoreductase [Amycolatopsis pithecellobii]
MRFGVVIAPKIDDWGIFKYAEDLGYDVAWACDSQMLWSDCYATLALAAANTSRISLGPGVAAAGTRIAPVTAHSIASISKLAPGRTVLGIGTGHTSMRVMGQKPMKAKDFEEYVRVLRALLSGEETEVSHAGRRGYTRFLNREHGFVDLAHPIPIIVGANGPQALAIAGAVGDGLLTIGTTRPDDVQATLSAVRSGAAAAGRALPDGYPVTTMTNVVVLQPGEPVTSDRVAALTDSWVGAALHFAYEMWRIRQDDAMVPPPFHSFWAEYCSYVDSMETPLDRRHLQIHDGHATFLPPAERRFLTEDAIRAVTIIGSVEEIAEQVKAAESAGVTELAIQSPLATARDVMRDFAEKVRPCL